MNYGLKNKTAKKQKRITNIVIVEEIESSTY